MDSLKLHWLQIQLDNALATKEYHKKMTATLRVKISRLKKAIHALKQLDL